jgi:hypothetical protein
LEWESDIPGSGQDLDAARHAKDLARTEGGTGNRQRDTDALSGEFPSDFYNRRMGIYPKRIVIVDTEREVDSI